MSLELSDSDADGDGVPPARRPGRPRSQRAHRAILQAALETLASSGYASMSMEEVQRRAGVGKATIYRRWSSKEALVKDAVSALRDERATPDTGSLAGDFAELAAAVRQSALTHDLEVLMPRILSEVAGDEEMHRIFYANFVEPRRRVVRGLLERAQARGEVRADIDLEIAVDVLIGPVGYRFVITGGDLEAALGTAPEALALVLEGLSPR